MVRVVGPLLRYICHKKQGFDNGSFHNHKYFRSHNINTNIRVIINVKVNVNISIFIFL
ncbi:hypothetical protein J2Z37_004880 [Ammoniphilus resinae]|uniref:Uncharacterized protein n=1 Tax=Ammoniphilus resinae TaxID=861532 RepID=A0ABS4GX57_9BACL|nr:hypothetical protein [Ammoniphilus resinae]